MKIIKFIGLALVVFNFKLNAQSVVTFNKTYDVSLVVDWALNVLELPDGYLTAITSAYQANAYKLEITKTDLNGNLFWQKEYGDTMTMDFYYSLVKTYDSNFITGCYSINKSTNTPQIKLIKFDSNGDTVWKKENPPPPGYQYYGLYLIETADRGFLISGEWADAALTDGQAMLIKTDSLGNMQWRKLFGGSNFDAFFSSIQLPDKGYLSLGWTRSFGAGDRDWYLVKTDSLGNFKWQKTYGTNDLDSPVGITATSDSNYILAGGGWLNATTFYGRVIKVDTSGNVLIQKNYLNKPTSEFWWVRETKDGNFIGAGANRLTVNNKDAGWITLLDSNLDMIWTRSFMMGNQHAYFRDVQPTTDGGYIAAGFAFKGASNTQDAWLVKLDSLGCDSVGCATYVTGIAPSPLERAGVRLFPNPAKEYVTISFLHSVFTACRVRIIDIMGKEVYSQSLFIQKQDSLPVSNFAPGIYVVELNYEGRKEYQKFVKE